MKNGYLNKNYYFSNNILKNGIKDGIPIGLGYFAVSFSLGIAAKNARLTPFQGFLASILCNASAGEYAGFTLIQASASYIEMVIITLIVNARYLLMSCAISQKINNTTPIIHRFIIGFGITDELFGIASAKDGWINPYYIYGAMLIAIPCWSVGTALGIAVGNILSTRIVSALSVALYGMFIAIIIPPARKNKVIAFIIIICFATNYLFSKLSLFSNISNGMKTIILTIVISAFAAFLFPKKEEDS